MNPYALAAGDGSFKVSAGGLVFVPRGATRTYTVDSAETHLLGFSTPSTFGDRVQEVGKEISDSGDRRQRA